MQGSQPAAVGSDDHGADGPEPQGAAGRAQIGKDVCSLAKDDPEAALSDLRESLGACSGAALEELAEEERHEAACALGEVAKDADHFREAAEILLRLAETDDERGPRCSAEVFSRLFVIAPSYPDATQAGVDEMVALLGEMLAGPDRLRRLLALDACDMALESFCIKGAECRGGYPESHYVSPMSDKEAGRYKKVLCMLLERIDGMDDSERQKAAGLIVDKAPDLSRLGGMLGEAIGAVRTLCERRPEDRADIAKAVKAALAKQRPCTLDGAVGDAWKEFLDDMAGGPQGSA